MNITNTMCRLSELSQWEIDSLVDNMPGDGFTDFIHGESYIGARHTGSWGTWSGNSNPRIVTYKEMMHLLKPKWTIYNNTLPWADLSDKQKGKMLLAQLEDDSIKLVRKALCGQDLFIHCEEICAGEGVVYRAQPEPVKPEPTMAELFEIDWMDCPNYEGLYSEQMITKGWVKK
jgi:hypothetical protein